MITAEIKIHPEPVVCSYQNSYTSYTLMTGNQKEKYELDHQVALEEAKKLVTVGQIVKLSCNTNKVIISGFIENPADVIMYAGGMCVVYARHTTAVNGGQLRYAISEFDLTTLEDPVPFQLELKDGTNDIPK